jgi:hypothetical protein
VRDSNKMLWVVETLNHQPHLKSKVQSGNSELISDEKGQEDALAQQVQGTMHLGIPPWAKRLPALAKGLLQAALQAAGSPGEYTAGFKLYPVLERPDPNNPGMQQGFHDQATDWCQLAQDLTACSVRGEEQEYGITAGNRQAWEGLSHGGHKWSHCVDLPP